MKIKSVTTRILSVTLLVVLALAAGLMFIMTYFMNSLTDTIMLTTLQPMAKTAAQSVEGKLHALADRFFMIRDNSVFISPNATTKDKQAVLDKVTSGVEFVWLGLYEPDGALLVGSDDCPRNISGRKLYSLIETTRNLVIEDTSIGSSGLEILMGIPVFGLDQPASLGKAVEEPRYYLVGSYRYDVLSDVLGSINIGTHGTAFIINQKGALIAHKDLGRVFSHQSINQILGSSNEVQSVLSSMTQGQTGSASIFGSTGQIFVSYAPIRGTLWSLGIQAPHDDFTLAAQRALFVGTLIVLISLIFFSLILGLLIRRILSVPLSSITENARQLAKGNFEKKLPRNILKRHDEIGQLGSAFASMSMSIQGVLHEIKTLIRSTQAGALTERATPASYHGDYRLIVAGINATMDVICFHLDNMPGALMFFNEYQEPIYLNRAMYDILARHGFSTSDQSLLTSIISAGASEEVQPQLRAIFSSRSRSDDFYTTDAAITDVDGDVHNYTLSLGRIGVGSGYIQIGGNVESVCIMLILNDVTQLARAKADAEMASRAKSDFLSRMSHEMRTPMNAIMGMAAIGLSTYDVERKQYSLTKISEASRHLLGVINDILDMSKIEADKFELFFSEFNLENMLQRVINVVNFRVEEKQQNLFIELDSGLPVIIVSDEQRLAQVITNLLSNAVKFTSDHGTITLKAKQIDKTDDVCVIRFEIKDDGIGISAEQQKKLFSSFEQADGSISRKYGGTGLGLAISKRIVEMMDGQIWIESGLGQGTSVLFDINVQECMGDKVNRLLPEIRWERIRILVVDDSPEILEIFKSALEPYGVDCTIAERGEDALQLVEQNILKPFDLVFLDWHMPDMDGLELSRKISQLGLGSRIILISAANWFDIEQEARAAGIAYFLQKPLFPSVLLETIQASLDPQQKTETSESEEVFGEDILVGKHILIAEDVDINREIVLATLEDTGMEIEFATDGQEALDKFSADPQIYDLILMDVQMPLVDGYEAARRIRASGLPRAKTIPIIAMTANVFREDIERCLESGMNSHLGKPIDASELIGTLKKYLA